MSAVTVPAVTVMGESAPTSLVLAALAAGFVINAPRPTVLRLAPPLIVPDAELDRFVAALPALLDAA